jgi:hypothetical protein
VCVTEERVAHGSANAPRLVTGAFERASQLSYRLRRCNGRLERAHADRLTQNVCVYAA